MKEIILPTNLHCNSCVTKLAKVLKEEPRIHHWHADVTAPDKPVTIHGDLSQTEAVALIEKAGFATSYKAGAVRNIQQPVTKEKSFWKDITTWKKASFNTFNCLVGCAIGDFGMIIFLQIYYPQTPMALQMVLAIIAGLVTSIILETNILKWKEKLNWSAAFKMAISMSFLSMVAMEIAMNVTDFAITGGKADLSNPAYWLAFIPAALAGFLTPLPYNYFKLKKYNQSCH